MNTSLQKKRGKKSMKSTHDQRSPDLSLITLSTLLLWNRKHYSQITGRRVPDIDIFSLFNSEYSWLISVLLLVLQLGSSKCYVNGGSSWVEQHIMAKLSTSSGLTAWSHFALPFPHMLFQCSVFDLIDSTFPQKEADSVCAKLFFCFTKRL